MSRKSLIFVILLIVIISTTRTYEEPFHRGEKGNWQVFDLEYSADATIAKTSPHSLGAEKTPLTASQQWIEYLWNGTYVQWYVRKPGIYATNTINFTVASDSDVVIDWEDFDSLKHTNGSELTIPVWYTYGNGTSPPIPEDPTWILAENLNSETENDTLWDSPELESGLMFKQWCMIHVDSSSSGTIYIDSGTVDYITYSNCSSTCSLRVSAEVAQWIPTARDSYSTVLPSGEKTLAEEIEVWWWNGSEWESQSIGNPSAYARAFSSLPKEYQCYPPGIQTTSPAQNEINVLPHTDISITFNVHMDSTTVNDSTFVVNARSTGHHQGAINYDSLTKTATFDPLEDFDVGEVVTVVLTTYIESAEGIPLDSSYIWSFTVAVEDAYGIFNPDSAYPSDRGAWSVIVADLNGNGNLDLACANYFYSTVSVLLNNGNGTFAPRSLYPTGSEPYSVFAGDFDSDEDIDLVTANRSANSVTTLYNNGDGTFPDSSSFGAGVLPFSVFAADLDGDADLDLIVANSSGENISVLKNNGDGTFAPDVFYTVGGGPVSVFAADFDNDYDVDVAVANTFSYNVSVLLNNGDGTFASHTTYPVGENPSSVYAADLDNDGNLDLMTANTGTDNLSVLINNGNGTFQSHSVYPVDDTPVSIFAADVNGDGSLDLIIANDIPNYISVLLNDGDGTFTPDSVYPVGERPQSVFAADLNGDGFIDLATANFVSQDVSVLMNVPPSVPETLWIKAYSPVDLIVTDPICDSISIDFNTIQDATYDDTIHLDEDEDTDDLVTIPHPYVGEYMIRVIREDEVPQEDSTYDLGIRINGSMETQVVTCGAVPPQDEEDTVGYEIFQHLRGDANGNDETTIADVVFLINYILKSGEAPDPVVLGDVNCNGNVEISDAVYLVIYLFKSGEPPCS